MNSFFIRTFLGARKVPKETALPGKSLLRMGFGEKAELVQLGYTFYEGEFNRKKV